MCDCIEKIKEKLLRKMEEQTGITEVVEVPMFVNHSLYPEVQPYFPVVGKYKVKNACKKFDISLYPTYCPFCGEKYDKDE